MRRKATQELNLRTEDIGYAGTFRRLVNGGIPRPQHVPILVMEYSTILSASAKPFSTSPISSLRVPVMLGSLAVPRTRTTSFQISGASG